MSDLLDLLKQHLGDKELSAISQKVGIDVETAKKAIGTAVPAIIAGLGRQAASPEGASKLNNILDEEDHGGILDKLLGLLTGGHQEPETKAELVEKTLGAQQQRVEQAVTKSAGIDLSAAKKLLAFLAPIIIGILHKKKTKSKDLDAEGLPGYLQQEQSAVGGESGGLLAKLLDQDGDDDLDISDITKVAMGKLFGS